MSFRIFTFFLLFTVNSAFAWNTIVCESGKTRVSVVLKTGDLYWMTESNGTYEDMEKHSNAVLSTDIKAGHLTENISVKVYTPEDSGLIEATLSTNNLKGPGQYQGNALNGIYSSTPLILDFCQLNN